MAAEMEVGQKDRRPTPVGGGPSPRSDAQEEVRQEDGDDDDQRGGGDDPATSPPVEGEDRRPPRCGALPEQDTGDDESRDDEEDVHSDVATRQRRDPEWKSTTRSTATARRPSTSGRKGRSSGAVPDSSPDARNLTLRELVSCSANAPRRSAWRPPKIVHARRRRREWSPARLPMLPSMGRFPGGSD